MIRSLMPAPTREERLALVFMLPLTLGLIVLVVASARSADFPISLWVSIGGIVTSAAGVGGVIATWGVRALKGVTTKWIDAMSALLTLSGALLTFVGFWWTATKPSETWDLDQMPAAGFVALLALLCIVSGVTLFMAAATRSSGRMTDETA